MGKGTKPAASALDVAAMAINQGQAVPVGEIRATMEQGIETLDGQPMDKLREIMADEAFMNEIVEIRIHKTSDKNAPVMAMPQVNGVNQPIFRSVTTPVKRKYVEALARARQTDYEQTIPDASSPDKMMMVPSTVLAFPFEVIRDANPLGRPWLERIMQEAA